MQLFQPTYNVEECLKEIRTTLESGWTGQGPKCEKLEKAWCEYADAKHTHFVSSCTAALHLAVELLNLPKDSLITTTPLTFVSTNAAILYSGHRPYFCDVGDDLSLNYESVMRAIDNGAKAVIWVHYGGSVSLDFEKFLDERNKNFPHIGIIEDCAHAAGARYPISGKMVGSLDSTYATFSMHSVKNLNIFDGGFLCCPKKDDDVRARRLSWMGIDKSTFARTNATINEVYKWSYDVPELGYKYNANDIAASIGLVQLKSLDRDNAYRKQIYEWYSEYLNPKIVKLVQHSKDSSHHLVVIKVPCRDKLISVLKANNVAPGVHYLPNYNFKPFIKFSRDCGNVEVASKEIVSLPCHLQMTRKDVNYICEIVNASV